MSKILTQEEIDALLQSARRFGGRGEKAVEPAQRATKFDFRKQKQAEHVSSDMQSALRAMHERFAASFSSSLSLMLRDVVTVSIESVESRPYDDFTSSLLDPTVIITTSMKPLDGIAVIEFNSSVVFPLIDIVLGGPGVMPNHARPITDIEWSIFKGVIEMALNDLQQAWLPVMPDINFAVQGHETRPHMVHACQPHETALIFTIRLKLNNSEGFIHLCFPAAALKPLFDKLSYSAPEQSQGNSKALVARLADQMRQAEVTTTAEIRGTKLTVDELLQLREGDVLRLDHRLSQPASIAVNGCEKFIGTLGAFEGRKTVSLQERAG